MPGHRPRHRQDFDLLYWVVAFSTAVAWVVLYALCVAILYHVF
ncbi:hypothetical protein [Nguyenibacter vanlangensis]|nr:hypothetical protein [Nguyenibacter vanlangensis]